MMEGEYTARQRAYATGDHSKDANYAGPRDGYHPSEKAMTPDTPKPPAPLVGNCLDCHHQGPVKFSTDEYWVCAKCGRTWIYPKPAPAPASAETQLAQRIIEAIPGALGMRPDPWPVDGPDPHDGEPHKTVVAILGEAMTLNPAPSPPTPETLEQPTIEPYVPDWLERYVSESQWPVGHSFNDVACAVYVFWLRVKAYHDDALRRLQSTEQEKGAR